jgi:hypothetical protein
MALQAAVQGAATEIGDGVLQATKHIVQGQQSLLPERNHDGFLGRRQHRAPRRLWTHGSSAIVVRLRHLRTVFAFRP